MKILVIRFSSIGDIVLTSALLRCLHQQVEGAEIHYLTKSSYATLLSDNPHVSRVHVLEEDPRNLQSRLRAEHFDFVADLQGNRKSRHIGRSLHAKYATYDKQDVARMMLVLTKKDRTDHRHVAERYFDAVKPLGVTPDGKGLECYYEPSDITPLLVDRKHHQLPADFLDKPYAVISVGSQHVTKCIPLDKLQVVCSYISGPVLLLGDANDRQRIKEFGPRFHDNVLNLCGKSSLSQTMQLIDKAAVVLTGDSALMHMAAAFATPMVVLWGSTVPEFGFSPYKVEAANMEVDVWCRPCHRFGFSRCPLKHFDCMEKQKWQRIAQAVKMLVDPSNNI